MPNYNNYRERNGRQQHQNAQQYQVEQIREVDTFWEDKSKKIPKKDLFSEIVKKYVDILSKEKTQTVNKDTQIRKFYNEVLRFKMKLILNKGDENIFAKLLPYIKMINAKLSYSCERKHISQNCKNLFTICINRIEDIDDFMLFVDFFEAFIAFYKK